MLGREELDKLNLRKQALLLESELNRVAFRAEVQTLRSATSWVSDATRASREFAPLLPVLAPLADLFLTRRSRRSDSWLSRVTEAMRLVLPLYRLWKGLSSLTAKRKEAAPVEPAT